MRIFILFACVVAMYFGGQFAWKLYGYVVLDSSAPAHIVRWDIEEDGSRFAIRALYTYQYKENIVSGSSRFDDTLFLNDATALASIRECAKQQWTVYFDTKHPEQSTLYRAFPQSLAIRFVISILISGYFFLLHCKQTGLKASVF